MPKKRKKRGSGKKGAPQPFRKSLRQATHPVPGEKVEESEKKYDRKQSKEDLKKELDQTLGE